MDRNKTTAPINGTVEDALKLIRDGDVIATPCYSNEPAEFLSRLHTVAPGLKGVRLWSTNPVRPYPVLTDPELTGQVCSESIGTRQYSGTGGASDFAYGAYRSRGGRSIIAINSTAKNGSISKIQASLSPGAVVTISRNLVDYVVTEYGIAKLRDRTVRQRVENLIAVAHPDFRRQLREEAEKNMLW